MADFNVTKDNLKDYLSKNSTLKVEYDQYKKQHTGESDDAITAEFVNLFNDEIDGLDNNTSDKAAYSELQTLFKSDYNKESPDTLSLGEILTAYDKASDSEKATILQATGYKNINELRFAVAFTKQYASDKKKWGQDFENALAAACKDPCGYLKEHPLNDENGKCICFNEGYTFDSRPTSIYTSNFNQSGGCNLTDNPFVTEAEAEAKAKAEAESKAKAEADPAKNTVVAQKSATGTENPLDAKPKGNVVPYSNEIFNNPDSKNLYEAVKKPGITEDEFNKHIFPFINAGMLRLGGYDVDRVQEAVDKYILDKK